jgi:hypothetical protein
MVAFERLKDKEDLTRWDKSPLMKTSNLVEVEIVTMQKELKL